MSGKRSAPASKPTAPPPLKKFKQTLDTIHEDDQTIPLDATVPSTLGALSQSSGDAGEASGDALSGFFPISFDPIPGPYYAVSLPFSEMDKTPLADRPGVCGSGTITDEKGNQWFAITTDIIRSENGVDVPVVYKLYNKSTSDPARDQWKTQKSGKPVFKRRGQ